jgi:mono/diheme cytochrome c family protein
MKTHRLFLYAMILAAFGLGFAGCSDDDDDEDNPFVATQADLDKATIAVENFSGGNFAHGGPNGFTGDSTVREVYASTSDLSGEVSKGTIVTKHTFKADANGNKTDQLLVTFAMIKREAGYDTDAQNWEYVVMPYDAGTDYSTHPNGTLPGTDSPSRGADVNNGGCKGCHSAAGGGDYRYVND